MAVLGGGSETIAFSSLKNSFGLYWGSVDTYNFAGVLPREQLRGDDHRLDVQPPMLANGGQTDYASNGYVVIGALPFFDRVVVSFVRELLRVRQCPGRRRDDAVLARSRSRRPGPCCCSASRVSDTRAFGEARDRSRPSPDRTTNLIDEGPPLGGLSFSRTPGTAITMAPNIRSDRLIHKSSKNWAPPRSKAPRRVGKPQIPL